MRTEKIAKMKNTKRLIVLSSLFASSVGCTICSNPFDYDYVTYGSRTPRHDMKHGRVGSPFSEVAPAYGPTESVEAIDGDYAEILEGSESGPVFQHEPMVAPDVIELPSSSSIDEPIRLSPAK